MSDAQRAIELLYEDAGLLDELADDDARLLMQWAEKEIEALALRHPDEAEFDEAVSQLRQLLTRMNRYVGRHAYLTPEEQQDWVRKIVESASNLGYNIPIEQMSAPPSAQGAPDTRTVLTGLLQAIDSAKSGPGEAQSELKPAPTDMPLLTDTHTGDTESNDEKIEPQD